MTAGAISTELLAPRLPVVGRIQIGGKVRGQKYPEKYDHFKIRKLTRGEDGNFELDHELHEVLGPKPTVLDVRLPFDTKAENLYAQMVHYPGRTCARKCDGEEYVDPRTGVGGPCERLTGRECPCNPYARLGVILEAASTFGGLHVYRTTSWASVAAMATVLRTLEQELETLRGLPMQMQLHPGEVRYQENGVEKTATAYRVALVLRASFDEAREAMLEYHRQNRIARREIKMIAGATVQGLDEFDRREEQDIVAEFYPKALTAGPEKTSRLAEINAAPKREEDDGTPVEVLIARVRELIEEAQRAGLTLNDAHLEGFDAAIESKNEGHLRTGIDWLETQIEGAEAGDVQPEPQEAPEPEDPQWAQAVDVLRDLVDEAESLGAVGDAGRAAVETAIEAGDMSGINRWVDELNARIEKHRAESQSTGTEG